MIKINVKDSSIQRLDHFLAEQFPEHTRSFLKKLILAGKIKHNSKIAKKASTVLAEGDSIVIESFELPPRDVSIEGYDNFFEKKLIHQGEHFLAINKPAGLIVHPSSDSSETIALSDLLIEKYPEIASVGEPGRPGIIHRLDGDTSGIILVARTQHGYEELTKLFRSRTIKKEYYAVVKGHPDQHGNIHEPIQRHPLDPRRMACMPPQIRAGKEDSSKAREAHTEYDVVEYFDTTTLIKVTLHTGRTHQIRVHLAHHKHPLIGDGMYGIKDHRIKRQALHAYSLEFEFDGKKYHFTCPLPGDFKRLLPPATVEKLQKLDKKY